MKRNSLFKGIVLSTIVSAILTGCGGTDTINNNNNENQETDKTLKAISMTGKAIDGYLQYATVCLDIDGDGYCQSTEPMTTTLKDGSFKLDITPKIQEDAGFVEAMLLVYGGKDADTGVDFNGKLLAPTDTVAVHITPITTLVAKAVQKEIKGLTKEQIKAKVQEKKEEVAQIFGIEVADIALDPIAVKAEKPELIRHSLKIQKAVEAMVGGTGDDDKIEEVYEKLAEKLSEVRANKGIDELLEKAYAGDVQLQKAKDVSANIDLSFEKFDGDLQKVAYVTKQDLKKVVDGKDVQKRESNDELFAANIEWDVVFIKDGLEDIGFDDPSDADIALIKKEIIGAVKPGVIFDLVNNKKEVQNGFLKEVQDRVVIQEQEKKEADEVQDALKNGQSLAFKDGEHMYWFEVHQHYGLNIEYGDLVFDSGKINFKDFEFSNGKFEEDTDEHDNDLILKNGDWVEESDSEELSYKVNSDKSIEVADENLQITFLKTEDINELEIPELDLKVAMPKGAKKHYLKFKMLEDEYSLEQDRDSGTVKGYINNRCESQDFVGLDKKSCDGDTIKGLTRDGQEWEVKDIQGKKILEVARADRKNKKTIYAEYNGRLYEGDVKLAAYEKVEVNYNKVAIDAIQKAVIDAWEKDEFPEVNGGSSTANQDVQKIQDYDIDYDLTASVSLSGNILSMVFNKNMSPAFGTTGDYALERNYWKDPKTFVMDLKSFTPAGVINFGASNFKTIENRYLASDIQFVFPSTSNSSDGGSLDGSTKPAQNPDATVFDFTNVDMYWLEAHMDYNGELEAEYGKNTFANNKVTFNDYDFIDGAWIKDTEDHSDLILKDGAWIVDQSESGGEIAFTVNVDKSLAFDAIGMKVEYLGEEVITESYIEGVNLKVPLTGDAKKYTLRFTQVTDKYELGDNEVFVGTLGDFMLGECNQQNLVNADRTICTAESISGKTKDGENWELKTVDGMDILEVTRSERLGKKRIFAQNNGKVYEGSLRMAGRVTMETNYNKIALVQIEDALGEAWARGDFKSNIQIQVPQKDYYNIAREAIKQSLVDDEYIKDAILLNNNTLAVSIIHRGLFIYDVTIPETPAVTKELFGDEVILRDLKVEGDKLIYIYEKQREFHAVKVTYDYLNDEIISSEKIDNSENDENLDLKEKIAGKTFFVIKEDMNYIGDPNVSSQIATFNIQTITFNQDAYFEKTLPNDAIFIMGVNLKNNMLMSKEFNAPYTSDGNLRFLEETVDYVKLDNLHLYKSEVATQAEIDRRLNHPIKNS